MLLLSLSSQIYTDTEGKGLSLIMQNAYLGLKNLLIRTIPKLL